MGAALGLPTEEAARDAVVNADIICAATTSATPLFDGCRLWSRAHLNAVGPHITDGRELDEDTMARAAVAAVDSTRAWVTTGELAGAAAASTGQARVTFCQLLTRDVPAELTEGVTVFKPLGAADADLAVTAAPYRLVAPDSATPPEPKEHL